MYPTCFLSQLGFLQARQKDQSQGGAGLGGALILADTWRAGQQSRARKAQTQPNLRTGIYELCLEIASEDCRAAGVPFS